MIFYDFFRQIKKLASLAMCQTKSLLRSTFSASIHTSFKISEKCNKSIFYRALIQIASFISLVQLRMSRKCVLIKRNEVKSRIANWETLRSDSQTLKANDLNLIWFDTKWDEMKCIATSIYHHLALMWASFFLMLKKYDEIRWMK